MCTASMDRTIGVLVITLSAAGAPVSSARAQPPDTTRVQVDVVQTRDKNRDVYGEYGEETAGRRNFVAFKVGSYDPEGPAGNGILLGVRAGSEFDRRLDMSFNADFYRRSFKEDVTIAETIDENGNVVSTTVTKIETSSNLIPLGGSIGFRLPGSQTVSPFVGAGVAYEILMNNEDNFVTREHASTTYTGFGWQLFGGMLVPVGTNSRFLGELWFNDSTVSRDVKRFRRGLPVRKEIDVGGLGARLGVEFAY